MRRYLLINACHGTGAAGFDSYRLQGTQAVKCGSFLDEVSAGVTIRAPKSGVLYCTDERFNTESPWYGGRVYAARLDPESGALEEINHVPSGGYGPSFCAVDAEEKWLVVTHFGAIGSMDVPKLRETIGEPVPYEGAVCLFRMREDGGIGALADTATFPYENGRETHAHSVKLSPDGRFFVVCDMGGDKVWRFTIENGKLAGRAFRCDDGMGPRYSAFHPEKPLVFVNYEEQPYLSGFRYDADGELHEVSRIRLLREDETGKMDRQSGLAIHPDGRHLYSAMRGKNLLSVIEADGETGALRLVQQVSLAGVRPKDCAVSPDGRYLSVVSRDNGLAELYEIGEDGTLGACARQLTMPFAGFSLFCDV